MDYEKIEERECVASALNEWFKNLSDDDLKEVENEFFHSV